MRLNSLRWFAAYVVLSPAPLWGQGSGAAVSGIDIEACGSAPLGELLHKSLLVEVSGTPVAIGPAAEGAGWSGLVVQGCGLSSGTVTVEVRPSSGAAEVHALDLSDVPPLVRPRTLAVALVEWVRTLESSLVVDPQPELAPPRAQGQDALAAPSGPARAPARDAAPALSPRPANEAKPEAPARPRRQRLLLDAAVGATAFGAPASLLPRLALGAVLPLAGAPGPAGAPFFSRWALSLRANASRGAQELRVGTVQLSVFGGEFGVGYFLEDDDAPRREGLSLWGVLDVADAIGQGTSVLAVSEPPHHLLLMQAKARVEFRAALSEHWVLAPRVELGGFLLGGQFEAAGEPVYELRGYVAGVELGLGYQP